MLLSSFHLTARPPRRVGNNRRKRLESRTIVGDISLRLIDFTVITSLSPFGALKSFRSLLDNDDDLAFRSNLPPIRAGSSGFPLHFSPRHAILIVASSSSLYDPFSISPIVFGK